MRKKLSRQYKSKELLALKQKLLIQDQFIVQIKQAE